MTHFLGADAYGNIIWTLSLVATINSITDLGFGSAHVKRISENKDIDDCISTYAAIQLILITTMVVTAIISITTWRYFFNGFLTDTQFWLLILFVAYFGIFDLSNIAINTYNAKTEMFKSQIISFINSLVRVPLVIVLCISYSTALEIAYAYIVTALVSTIISLYLLRRDHYRWKHPTLIKSYCSFAFPLALIAIIYVASSNVDKILIGFFYANEDVAFYASSQTLMSMLAMIGIAVATLTYPYFSTMFIKGDIKSIIYFTNQAERYISIIASPIVVFIFVSSTEIVSILFGVEFSQAGDTLRLLAISTLFIMINQVYITQLIATNHPGITAKISIFSFFLNVGLMLILVPHTLFGITLVGLSYVGAAIASLASNAAALIITRIFVIKLNNMTFNKHILSHMVAGVVTGTILIILQMYIGINGFIMVVVNLLLSIILYLSILCILRELKKEDIYYILDTINYRKMKEYIVSEIYNGSGGKNG